MSIASKTERIKPVKHMMSHTLKTCKSCSAPVEVSYCSTCGQRYLPVPFTIKSVFDWITDLFDFNKGYFYTLYVLILKPNQLITDFLYGKTKKYINPIKFILINGAAIIIFGAIIEHFFPGPNKSDDEHGEVIMYTLATLYIVTIYFFNLLFFWKSKYNRLEHLIITIYECCVFLILAIPIGTLINIFSDEPAIVSFAISLWSITMISFHSFYLKKIHGGHTVLVIIKSIFSVIVSFLLMVLMANIISNYIIDAIV